jgi:hypothetical protein
MRTPDITPAQIVAIVQAVLALAVAYGLSVPPDARDAIIQLATVLAAVLPIGDAAVRRGRARVVEARVLAGSDS